nr:hypothetical protein [Tanacetum cinerariifolium]
MAYVKSFTDEPLKQEFEMIRKVQSHSQIQAFSQTLKRPGPMLEDPSSKRPKSPEAPTPSMPDVPISPAVSLPLSSRTRRKSLGQKHIRKPKSTLPKLDLHADAQTFFKVVVTEDSDDEDSDDEVWSTVVGWEVLSTHLGVINALYRIDGSTKHFATLRQILHMVDRQDLMKLYGLVVQYYKHHPVAGVGLLFWGDLQVLFDSQAGERVLVFGKINICGKYEVGGYTLFQMFMFWKRFLSIAGSRFHEDFFNVAAVVSKYVAGSRYVVPTGRVIVPTGRYIVPTSRVIVATGRIVSPGKIQTVGPG